MVGKASIINNQDMMAAKGAGMFENPNAQMNPQFLAKSNSLRPGLKLR